MKKLKGVTFEICIQPDAENRMIMDLRPPRGRRKIAKVSPHQWPRLHRLLWEIYQEEQRR